jgi:hypothetical protein
MKVSHYLILVFLIGLGVGAYYFFSRLSEATEALEITGPNAENSEDQLLACTAAQSAIKGRLATRAVFPFCSGVPVIGSGPEFIINSFFDLPDPSGIKRRHNFTVIVKRSDGYLATRISKLD